MILHGLVQWTPSKAAMQLRELKSEEETHRTTSRRSEKNFGEGFFSFLDHFHLSPPQARLVRLKEKIIRNEEFFSFAIFIVLRKDAPFQGF